MGIRMDLVADILSVRNYGPQLSTEVGRILVETHGLSPAAARQRISRASPEVSRLAYLPFSRNARFLYLEKDFGSDQYWRNLIKALQENNSCYGLALAALRMRGGIVLKEHFSIVCGAPMRQAKHLSPETIAERLIKASLIKEFDIPGVGNCLALIQGPDQYDSQAGDLRARHIVESILLEAVKDWIRKLGIGSYDKVKIRDDPDAPKIASFAWDLTAPSYLGGLMTIGSGVINPGFIACDVCLNGTINEVGLKPFIYKVQTLRSLGNVGRCIQIFVANRYTKAAFILAKKNGIIPATPESLFGIEVAEGLVQLSTLLRTAAGAAINPIAFDELFSKLGKIEGAAKNLRGALFEFVAAEIVRDQLSSNVRMNIIIKNRSGKKAEIDIVAQVGSRDIYFIECKGYLPSASVPEEYVKKWLTESVPNIHKYAIEHPDWSRLNLNFEFWSTGRLTDASVAMIENMASKVSPNKYTLKLRNGNEIRDLAYKTKNKELINVLDKHFINHPLSRIDGGNDPAQRIRNSKKELRETLAEDFPEGDDIEDFDDF